MRGVLALPQASRLCRRKGKLYDHSACLEQQGLACCPWVSRSRRPATALTEGRPQRSRELGEDGAERARDKTTGVFRMVTGCGSRIPCQACHECIYICNICGVQPTVADTSPLRKPPYGADATRSLHSREPRRS
jgi:hypothetical protein